jgi:recombinational DNA repair protein RecR
MLDALKKKLAEKSEGVTDFLKISEKERNARFDVCKSCEHLAKMDFCKICSCYMPVKTYLPGQSCPLKKW